VAGAQGDGAASDRATGECVLAAIATAGWDVDAIAEHAGITPACVRETLLALEDDGAILIGHGRLG